MSMLKHRTIFLIKEETVYNTDPVPTGGANAVLVESPAWGLVDPTLYQRKPVRVSQGKLKPLWGGHLAQFKFDVEIKGSPAAGTAPEIAAALRSCSLAETIVAVTSVTYKPASSAQKSCTIYAYMDGKLIKGTGCRGMVSGSLEVGGAGKLSFTFIGHFVSETDAALPSPTYTSQLPPVVIAAPFSIDGRTPVLTKLDFDLGITLAKPRNAVAADGYGEIQVVDRNPTCSFDDEDVLVGTYDWYTKWKSNAAINLTSGVIGSVAGNRYAFTFPAVTYTELGDGDKSGIDTREVKGMLAESSGDDEFQLVFT